MDQTQQRTPLTAIAVSLRLLLNQGVGSVSPQVTARIQKRVSGVLKTTHTVTFNVRGGSSNGDTGDTTPTPPAIIPSHISKVSGDNQTGETGEALSNPFVVQFLDTSNNPINDVTVSFSIVSGGGSLSDSSDTTDSSGRAETTLTLGSSTGTTDRPRQCLKCTSWSHYLLSNLYCNSGGRGVTTGRTRH